jgi:rhodanese-related sulfurtransferase
MPVREAAALMVERHDHGALPPGAITNRVTVANCGEHAIVCTDSIAFALPEDRERNVLCTGGHTGRSAVSYLRSARPFGFICSDGGVGRNRSGVAGLEIVETDGLAGATVDVMTARMGDGLSTYQDGVISAVNRCARERGVEVGMKARDAALRLLRGGVAGVPHFNLGVK